MPRVTLPRVHNKSALLIVLQSQVKSPAKTSARSSSVDKGRIGQ